MVFIISIEISTHSAYNDLMLGRLHSLDLPTYFLAYNDFDMRTTRFYHLLPLIFITILFCSKEGHGQDFSKTMAAEYGVKFTEPPHFKMYNNNDKPFLEYFFYMAKPDDRRRNILPDFYLVNRDSSILILIESYDYSPMVPDIFNHYWIDPSRIGFNHTVIYADTTHGPVIYYPARKRRYSNADWIAEFTRDLGSRNTLGDFKYNRNLVINKHEQIFLQVTYLFKESSKAQMDEVLKSTQHMFRFEDRPQVSPASIKTQLDRHYVQIDPDILGDSLDTKWNEGKIYRNLYYFWGEQFAFERNGIVISVKFPTNDKWPYMNHLYQERPDTTANMDKWHSADNDHRRFLALAKDTPYKCPQAKTGKLNADEAYVFSFSHDKDDLYRGVYRDCKVLVFHKRNLGSVIIKYYYRPQDNKKVKDVMESTWGEIAFKDKAFFDSLDGKVYPY